MNNEVFSFTPEQKANLEKWKAFLNTERARTWAIEEKEAIEAIHNILKRARFEEGNDLSAEQLDDVFRNMKSLIYNRALNRKLYEDNGLTNFNSRLRTLLFSSKPLVERVNRFLELKRVGILTVSHFLCAFSATEYPEIGWQTLDVLELDSAQLDNAYRQALREHNITSPQDYHGDTIKYLGDMIIFREIKNLLNIEFYNDVNNLLWLAYKQEVEEPKPTITSVSLERDLRDYLAENLGLVEQGLSLVKKEYHIAGVGNVDLLCQDKKGKYVVIETKKGRGSDAVIGQVLRYVGGLKRKEGRSTRAIIVLGEPDEGLDFALEAVKDFIKLKYYKVRFEITDSYINTPKLK